MNVIINLLIAAVVAGTPLLLGAMGEILTERSGNINLGVEGEMFMGAMASIAASYFYTSHGGTSGFISVLISVIFSFLLGAFGALIYSFLVITLRANQNVTGLILTIFGTGFGNFFGAYIPKATGETLVVSDFTKAMYSNIGPFNWMVYFAIIIAIILAIFLFKTRQGLSLRAVGENASAADTVGINVTKYRYFATVIGGGICGLGGMYIAMVQQGGNWVDDCVSGYGWLAVALVIFASWRTTKALWVALIFGGLKIARFYVNLPIPDQIYDMAPYIVTIVILVLTSMTGNKENSQPKACGVNYFREER
jgi:general nucleoside transport system permease protein